MGKRKIGVVGLGPMGGGIARVLVARGDDVFVWNRTAAVAKDHPGARPTASIAELIDSVDAVVVSLPSYDVTRNVLGTPACESALATKLLIQLSTGRPEDARNLQSWAERQGASFLAGCVLGYPRMLGEESMSILYGGSRTSFEEWAEVLAALAPGQVFVDEDSGAPAAVYGPLWHFYYGAYGAFLEAAAFADASGVDIRSFTDAATGMSRILVDGMVDSAERISDDRLAGDQATIAAIHRDLEAGQAALADVGIDGHFRAAVVHYLARAIEEGDQDKDAAAVFRHIRRESTTS